MRPATRATTSVLRRCFSTKPNTIRLGLLGAGRIGKVHAESVTASKGCEIVAVYDFLPEAAKEVADQYGAKVAADADEVITSPDVDAILICSPTNLHKEHIIKSAQAGKHIFAEKPMAGDSANVQECTAAVEKAGVKFVVGFNRRLDSNHMRLQTAIKSGEVGDLWTIRIISRDPAPPPAEYVKVSGGMFKDCSVHDFDMARFLAGSEVKTVHALTQSKIPYIAAEGDHDLSLVVLTHENGVMTTIENSRQTTYGYDQRVEVFGSKCAMLTDNLAPDGVTVLNNGSHGTPYHDFFMTRYMDSYKGEVTEFTDMVRGGDRKFTADARDGLMSVVIAEAAQLSATEGRTVELSEVMQPAMLQGLSAAAGVETEQVTMQANL